MDAYRALIVCAVQGDYIEWDDPMREPEAGACPFGECDCVPVVYVRGDVHRGAVGALEEARALIATAEQDGYVSAGWREDARMWASSLDRRGGR